MKEFKVKHKVLLSIVIYILFIFCLYRLGVSLIRGVGDDKTIMSASYLAVFLFFIFRNTILTYCIGLPIVISTCFYAPIASKYGPPNYYLLGSLLGTDTQEIKDYLSIVCFSDFLLTTKIIAYFTMVILFSCIINKISISKQRVHTHLKTISQLIIIITLFIFIPPMNFFHNIYGAYEELKSIPKDIHNIDWKITSIKPKYNDYVLIIGESVRRDYMHVYGYPIKNTNFLDSISKEVLSNITASNFNTISALTQTLNLVDKKNRKFEHGKNIISLAKSSGFETFWISNQGRNGIHDTPVSKIAIESDHPKFLKNGAYDSYDDEIYLDSNILPFIRDYIIGKPITNHRLFVVHIMGSHIDPCNRISNYKEQYGTKFEQYKQIACYISSIKQTDELLGDIYNVLVNNMNNTGRSFSMFYISDHSLSYNSDKHKFSYEKDRIKQYQIPYIKISSDTEKDTIYTSRKSALFFFEEFAHWIGVKSELFPYMTLFSEHIYEDKYIDEITAKDEDKDQAIDISEYLK